MRKIINDADHVVPEMMEGFVGAYGRYFRKHPEVNAILSRQRRKDKVALVIGGGSGHEPMFGGFVGKGLADAAACGNIFASPDPNTIYEAAKAVYTVMPVSLSSMADFNLQYYAAPSECLFALSNHKLIDYSIGVTGVGSDRLTGTNLFISAEMRDKLYEGQDITTHAGYANSWNTSIPDANGNYNYACVKKYYYDAGQEYGANVLLMKLQIVPVLRMSEVYLILLETTTDLEEANRLYADYMAARNVNVSAYFTDLASVKNFVLEEIRREFYAEGHLFYAYKRQGIRKMLWGAAEVGEAEYILPLPDSEYDPGTGK